MYFYVKEASAINSAEINSPFSQGALKRSQLSSNAAMVTVHIDSIENNVPAGELTNSYISQPVPFRGLGEILLKTEAIYNYLNFPEAERECRHFDVVSPASPERKDRNRMTYQCFPPARPLQKQGRMVFLIHTLFRRGGSWQGIVYWPTQKEKKEFLSALQCMQMIDEAIRWETEKTQ